MVSHSSCHCSGQMAWMVAVLPNGQGSHPVMDIGNEATGLGSMPCFAVGQVLSLPCFVVGQVLSFPCFAAGQVSFPCVAVGQMSLPSSSVRWISSSCSGAGWGSRQPARPPYFLFVFNLLLFRGSGSLSSQDDQSKQSRSKMLTMGSCGRGAPWLSFDFLGGGGAILAGISAGI